MYQNNYQTCDLQNEQLPQFTAVRAQDMLPTLKSLIAEHHQKLSVLLAAQTQPDWELIRDLEALDQSLYAYWGLIRHLYAVIQTPVLRDAYALCLALISEYESQLHHNRVLYRALQDLTVLPATDAQRRLLHNKLQQFQRAGIDLSPLQQKKYRDIEAKLAQLAQKFSANVLDASASWEIHITNSEQVRGIPDHVLHAASYLAKTKQQEGWIFNLEEPCYIPVLTYADQRALRAQFYRAYVTRASDQGADTFDNSSIIWQILNLRHALSQILGFENYAQYVLAENRMLADPQQVCTFLQKLLNAIRAKAQTQLCELEIFAQQRDGIDRLQAWDILYYQEKLRQQQFAFDDAMIRPYFPIDAVLSGLFSLLQHLFSVKIVERTTVDVWHSDVRFFVIYDVKKQVRGCFYLDLYARSGKHEGAWMDNYQARRRISDDRMQLPIAFLVCNFAAPLDQRPTLLTHEELLTLAHEMGHGLHHMLSVIDYADISGTNGVEWDAVELPSQFLECFFWDTAVLHQCSRHYQTGESLPDKVLKQLCATRNFQMSLFLTRQLEFALFDLYVHAYFDPAAGYQQVQTCLDRVRNQLNVLPVHEFNRFQHTFSHIFSGGYAVGYYSYLWSQILALDCFKQFKQAGILNQTIGKKFLQTILEQGGAAKTDSLFKQFCGHDPNIATLLELLGV